MPLYMRSSALQDEKHRCEDELNKRLGQQISPMTLDRRPLGILCLSDPWVFYNAYFGRLLSGLAEAAKAKNIHLQFFFPNLSVSSDGNPAHDKVRLNGLQELEASELCGAVVLTGREISGADLERLRKMEQPIVFLNTDLVLEGFFQVNSGVYERTLVAARYLLHRGHRKLGMLSLNKASGYNIAAQKAIEQVFQEYHLSLDLNLLEEVEEWDFANPLDLQGRFVHLYNRGASGIICAEVHQAVLGLELLKRKGIEVPRDVSLISFGPLPEAARLIDPALCLVESDIKEAGRQCFKLFQEAVQKKSPRVHVMPWSLGVGGSSVSSPGRHL